MEKLRMARFARIFSSCKRSSPGRCTFNRMTCQCPRNGVIGMYGPPQSCKRKTKDGSWSAPMYSAFGGVSDSGP